MGKNKGARHGKRPPSAHANFRKGDSETIECAKKSAEAVRRKWARIHTLREAAEAIRSMPDREGGEKTGFTEGVAATLAMFDAAKGGDAKAYKVLAELMGEMETTLTVKELPKLVDDV